MFGFEQLPTATLLNYLTLYGLTAFVLVMVGLIIIRRRGPGNLPLPANIMAVLASGTTYMMLFGVVVWVALLLGHPAVPLPQMAVALASFVLGFGVVISRYLLIFHDALNRQFRSRWVKAMDFPYLAFGFVGLIRVANNSPSVTDRMSLLDTVGLLFIACALSIRLAKAIVEVFFDDFVGSPVQHRKK